MRKHVAIILIIIGWAIFALEDTNSLLGYLKIMFSISSYKFIDSCFLYFLRNYGLLFIVSIIFSIPIKIKKENKLFKIIKLVLFVILFTIPSDNPNPYPSLSLNNSENTPTDIHGIIHLRSIHYVLFLFYKLLSVLCCEMEALFYLFSFRIPHVPRSRSA